MTPALSHIRAWIFDLDNTLYPASADLFGLMDVRMTAYVARTLGIDDLGEARRIQKGYFQAHGTTMAGLMLEHDVDPHHYLADVHDIDLDVLAEDARLARLIARLPGRKLIFTNGDAPYAERVLAKLGLSKTFEAIHDIHASAYKPKPHEASYAAMVAGLGVDPATSVFVEDMARNLKPAKTLGMTTVWLDNGSEQGHDADRSFVDHHITDLAEWLHSLLGDDQ
ncbi:pyrimidine 5'-nucleotidase [Sphingomonas oligoaromativorans]|uniref:pyrimidine 5'-nucleotidase n=1 Tax=Sphingomonas oligoaromativorans TaxID=575322 RepID=UPI00141FD336|nr:pyrimidine 5'-nucleotidase [Sphingomonas oligoaromativorans]NIJ34615.1 putative hydrolase of the HAD superfamily [Sphingomonas oligoaromativorans]